MSRRIILLIVGVVLVATGVAFSIKANLGTSPVSSLPYTLGQILGTTSGNGTIMVHSFFILLQVLILRKDYRIFNLLQLPLGIMFGKVIDLVSKLLVGVDANTYGMQLLLCAIGIILVGLGVAFEVEADIILLAIEGFCAAVVQKTGKRFGDVKTFTDISIVVTAAILGLLFLKKIVGIREGTIAAAVLVGQISKFVKKFMFTKK